MKEYTFVTYFTNNYVTLLLLSTLIMLLITNHKMKTTGLHYIWVIIGIVFTLTLCEAFEDICGVYKWNYRLLYFKTAMVYILYPLIAMLELYLVAPIKHKILMAAPYAVNVSLVVTDLFDTHLIYYHTDQYQYEGGSMNLLPILVLGFYVVMLGFYSFFFIAKRSFSKGIIALFMCVTSIITAIGERQGFATGCTETVAAVEMLTYYFFLAAISFLETQKKLYESHIELEQDRIKLLVAQIQPHFIFNSLATIQSLCHSDGEAAADCVGIFGDYLRANINSLSSEDPIPFSSELEHIKQYIKLEETGMDIKFDVVFELGVTNFKIPPLTVQPIVENAIKHGALTRCDGTGAVRIKTEETDDSIIITITDNGTGAKLTKHQSHHHSIGVENVKNGLRYSAKERLKQVSVKTEVFLSSPYQNPHRKSRKLCRQMIKQTQKPECNCSSFCVFFFLYGGWLSVPEQCGAFSVNAALHDTAESSESSTATADRHHQQV